MQPHSSDRPHDGGHALNRKREEQGIRGLGPGGSGLHSQSSPRQGLLERAHTVLNFPPEQHFGQRRHPRLPQVQCSQMNRALTYGNIMRRGPHESSGQEFFAWSRSLSQVPAPQKIVLSPFRHYISL